MKNNTYSLEPALLALPVGFFLGAVLFDIVGEICGFAPFFTAAYYVEIAGVFSGLVALARGKSRYAAWKNDELSKYCRLQRLCYAGGLLLFITALACHKLGAIPMVITLVIECLGFGLLIARLAILNFITNSIIDA